MLTRHDPMGLEPGQGGDLSAPADEYEPEARDLAQLLHDTGTVTAAQVDEVWRKWFDSAAGTPAQAEALAEDLRALVT